MEDVYIYQERDNIFEIKIEGLEELTKAMNNIAKAIEKSNNINEV